MKKIINMLIIYTILIYLCCLGVSFAYRPIPELVEGMSTKYRFIRSIYYFLILLPSIFLSGFAVSCAANWQHHTGNSKKRFSMAMLLRYRNVVMISIGLVFILMMNAEVLKPLVKDKKEWMEKSPSELKYSLETANFYLIQAEQGQDPYQNAQLAVQYANRAFSIAPLNSDAILTLKKSKDKLELEKTRTFASAKRRSDDASDEQSSDLDRSYTIKELVQKSKDCAAQEMWFESHYWAALAVEACKQEGITVEEAVVLSNEAWERLKDPRGEDTREENEYFRDKKIAYDCYMTKQYLEAYYRFKNLSKPERKHVDDPEVKYFLALSENALKNSYFFIDETENMAKRENTHDIYFAHENPDGTKDVIYIRGALDVKETGGDVRYLDGLTVISYSKAGSFLRQMFVPIAKVVSQPISSLPEDSLKELGINKKWKNVPFVMLKAVDREDESKISEPVYTYTETGLPEALAKAANIKSFEVKTAANIVPFFNTGNTFILPMSYNDFSNVNDAASGPDKMNILALKKFINSAAGYGFSTEVFLKNLVCRAVYPLLLLVLFVFAACMGWNYRIEVDAEHFKFRWLFLIPVYGLLMFFIIELCQYLFNTVNYVIVSACGGAGLLVAAVLYIIIFALMSFIFMSRKE
ncbi:MAG TPA: hypothetical protein DCP61_05545 [Treponema sp.]|nr:hypothetical protein [Treponema sp.]